MYQNGEKHAKEIGFSKFEEVTSDSQWHVSSSVSFKKESLGQKPIFIQPLSSLRVRSGDTVRFHARVSGIPKPEIQWFHNQQPILPTKDVVFHFEESTGMALMFIVDAYSEHAGQYSCRASNCAGEASCAAALTVTPKGKARLALDTWICFIPPAPTVTNEGLCCLSHCIVCLDLNILFFFLSLDYTVRALARQSSGKDVRESTKSQAVTDSSFTKQESKIPPNEIRPFQGSSYEYEPQVFESISRGSAHRAASVQNVELRHTASLSQSAENTEFSGNWAEEAVGEAPRILLPLQDLSVKCGDTAQFLCVLQDESSVDVTWTREGVKIEDSERLKRSQNGDTQFLIICNVQPVDQGLYSCVVHNDYGEETTSAVLNIEAKESQTRAVTKIALGSDIKNIKTRKESQIKTSHEVKRESSKKISSLSFTSCQSLQGTEKPGSPAHARDATQMDGRLSGNRGTHLALSKLPQKRLCLKPAPFPYIIKAILS
ncbi:myosin light chain kinase, smooth muscle-like [Mirounga angustirostris]|uniref:myosin light chain kinase, smooth muscle-like n=1 Tax=Mirounga angustirostris TaxID=9716 RepID=UPI00313ACE1A